MATNLLPASSGGTSVTRYFMTGTITGTINFGGFQQPTINVTSEIGGSAWSGNTFTAFRAGIYRFSAVTTGTMSWSSNGSWSLTVQGSNGQNNNRFAHSPVPAGFNGPSGTSGSVDILMNPGQTFVLSMSQNSGASVVLDFSRITVSELSPAYKA
jgi:hypothetical protein